MQANQASVARVFKHPHPTQTQCDIAVHHSHETFCLFADSSPDRSGRLLMRRRLERAQRAGQVGEAVRLDESDYLRDMHDAYRSGALRLRLDDAGDLDLARSVTPYFRVSKKLADEIVDRSKAVVKQWPKIADGLHVRAREQERMAEAFRLAC